MVSRSSMSNLESDEEEGGEDELNFEKIEDIPTAVIFLFVRSLKSDLKVSDEDLRRYIGLRNKYLFVNQRQMDPEKYERNYFLRVLNIQE
jgi:hypothetical protein